MTTQNIYNLADTWNAGATTFTAIKMNVTDTASAAASLLMDLQVDGASRFRVSKAGATTVSSLLFPGSSSGTVTIQPAAAAGTYTLTLPTDDGNAGQALLTDGSGGLSWGAVGGTPGGSNTQLQFNNSGAFAGASGLTTDGTNLTITGGSLTMTGNISSTTWGTSGIRFKGASATFTDTSAAGTVAAAYTNVYGGNTIAASNARTFTDYFTTFINPPTAGTNVTFTNHWALGLGGNLQIASASEQFFGTDLRIGRRDTANIRLGAADTSGVAATVTITIASPGVVTWTAHGLSTGTPVVFTTTGALPTGITSGTTYYVIAVDADTFRIATTLANAVAGTAVNTSGSQSGTHTGTRYNVTQRISMQGNTGVSNRLGADLIIQGSQGTGTGAGGSIIFQVAPAGSSGTAQNALATALTIDSSRVYTFAGTSAGLSISLGIKQAVFRDPQNVNAIYFGISTYSGPQLAVPSNGSIGFTNNATGDFSNNLDVLLFRDAANTLALRNGTNAQESRVYGSFTGATNFQRMSIKTLRESSGALSGASYTTTIAIPAYAHLVGVTTRVTTAITGATTYDVGDGTDVDLWGAAIGVALGSQSRTADFTAVAAVGAAATSRTVTLTANGSNFTGGVVEICLHYLTTEAD